MGKRYITETRFWLDKDGKVQSREVINESLDGEVDMAPHPTETRVVPVGDDGEIIFSQEIEESDDVPIDLGFAATILR